MKVLRTLFTSAIALIGIVSAVAQTTYTDEAGNQYQFKGHWYLNLQGGVQYTLDSDASFGHQITPNVQLGAGYQFNPIFGVRLQINSWKSKGGWDEWGYDDYTNHYTYTYVAPGLDFTFNLTNAISGWKPDRLFTISAFVGAGANIGWKNTDANSIYNVLTTEGSYADAKASLGNLWDGTKTRLFGRAGLGFDFHVCSAVTLGLELNANVINDNYNSKNEGRPDWYFNGLAGIRINLGDTYVKKEKPAPAPPKPVEREAEPAPALAPAPAPEPMPEPKPEPVKVKAEPIERAIFFTINTTTITASEQVKIDEVVKYLNDNPEAKVTVTGHADSGTGNEEINNKLAAKRANTTVNALKAAGIDASRISSSSKGDKEQPFAENDKNRCAIVVAAE